MPAFRQTLFHIKTGNHHEQCADPCRDVVYDIIQFCRSSAKIQISVILISYHGIHGIDSFVENPRIGPPIAVKIIGAITPSEVFSATVSIAAFATPVSSRHSVSLPTIMDTAFRDAAISPFSVPDRLSYSPPSGISWQGSGRS